MLQRGRMVAITSSCGSLAMLILVCSLTGGCTSLPNTSGYTAATIQVKQAVSTTGDVVTEELRLAIKAQVTTANDETVKKLNAAWTATMRSLDAMVAHAQSIEQIVDAGNKGAESAKQVADAVKKLVDAVKVDAITGASATLVQLSTDTVAFVYGEYSKYVAAKSLEEALDRFGPAMEKITALVQEQIADARRLFVEQIEAQVQQLGAGGSGYGDWIKRKDELSKKQEVATLQLLQLTSPISDAVQNTLVDRARQIEGASWNAMPQTKKDAKVEEYRQGKVNELKTSIAQMDLAYKQVAPYLDEYNKQLIPIRRREKAGRSLLGAAENAVAAWGVAHQQLVRAVKERKPVSVESLLAAVVEVRTLIQKWREL